MGLVLPTQACHLPQAGEGVLQAATLLGTGPAAPQRLLHLSLVHVQQGIQRELAEDLLRRHRTGGSGGTGQAESPAEQSPSSQRGQPPAEWQGPAAGGLASDPEPPLVRGHQPSTLAPAPSALRQQLKQRCQNLGLGGKEGKYQESSDKSVFPSRLFLFILLHRRMMKHHDFLERQVLQIKIALHNFAVSQSDKIGWFQIKLTYGEKDDKELTLAKHSVGPHYPALSDSQSHPSKVSR